MSRDLHKKHTGSPLDGSVSSLVSASRDVKDSDITNGRLIDVTLSAGADTGVSIRGDRVRGWIVVRKSANFNVWESSTAQGTLVLSNDAGSDQDVTLWVF